MGMPITIEIADLHARKESINLVFKYLEYVDEKFSTYKPESEISRINRGEISKADLSDDMRIIFMLAEETKQRTDFIQTQVAEKPYIKIGGLLWASYRSYKNLDSQDNLEDFYKSSFGEDAYLWFFANYQQTHTFFIQGHLFVWIPRERKPPPVE